MDLPNCCMSQATCCYPCVCFEMRCFLQANFLSAAYKMGKEYVYHYEGHVVSGIPLFTAQLSGVKVKATVTIHVIPNDVMVMKVSTIFI